MGVILDLGFHFVRGNEGDEDDKRITCDDIEDCAVEGWGEFCDVDEKDCKIA